jgi:hypothetical protein
MKQWREYLLDKRKDVRPFSQHLFVVFDRVGKLHMAMGGQVYREDGYVLSEIGPLFMVGLFGRKGVSLPEIKVWEASELRPKGGTVTGLKEWRATKTGCC